MRSGWRDPDSSLIGTMSDGLVARMATADLEEQRQAERDAVARQAQAELVHERAVLAAAQELAAAEGLPLRDALRQVGHTKAEFLAQRSAMMDVEDAREAARQQAAFRAWQQSQDASADTRESTVPSTAELPRQ